MRSVFDELDIINVNDEAMILERKIDNVQNRLSSIDDNVKNTCNIVDAFLNDLHNKSFSEIKEFIRKIKENLEDIAEKIY